MRSSRRLDPFQFLDGAGQRDHHFRLHNNAAQRAIRSGFEDGANLHFHDLRHRDAQADATHTHHWVGFVHTFDGDQQFFLGLQVHQFHP